MTVAALPATISYNEDGVSTVFAVPYRFKAAADLVVERIAGGAVSTLALGTDYSVTGGGTDAGGVLTRTAATNGATLRITRRTPRSQAMQYTTGDRFPAVSHEQALDRCIMIDQEQDSATGDLYARAILVPPGEQAQVLPPRGERMAGRQKILGVDPDTGDVVLIEIDDVYRGPPGPASNTRMTLAELKAAPITDVYSLYDGSLWKWVAGDRTGQADDIDTVASDHAPLSEGAWLRQRASSVTNRQAVAGAVHRTIADTFIDQISIMDFIPLAERDKIRARTSTANLQPYFAAAAATGKSLFVPAGSYHLAGAVGFSQRVTFQPGAQLYRDGGNLAFSGGIAAPIEQIFFGYVYPNIDIHNTLTPEGWVDWFGYDQDAIETCHKIFRVNRLGPRDYHVNRTVILDQSNREVIGCYGSAEGTGGTRLVLYGAAATSQPVVQVGTLNTANVLSCARRLNISGINTMRDGTIAPAASGRREDATPGWLVAGWYEGRMERLFDYGSPIHYRVYGTCACTLRDCSGVRPGGGSVNGHPDFYTAFAIGGYSTSFGFIGANASLTIENCGTAGGVGDASRMGLWLFGYIGDSWIRKFEMSQLEFGVYVDGADASGTTLTSLTAHQDVRISECVMDANVFNCITVKNLNKGGAITLADNYCALNAAGDAVLIAGSLALVSIEGGDIIAHSGLANYGIRITTSKRVTVSPAVKIKDCRVGLRAESCGELRLQPTIHRAQAGGTNGMELSGVARSYAGPIIDGDSAVFDYGVVTDNATNYSEVNVSGVNFGSFTTVSAGRKIWHNGATWGGGGTFGNNNIATGVLN